MGPWYRSLPPVTAHVPCGEGTHTIRWSDGKLELTGHPDAEAELVLAALGGETPACVEIAQTWDRYSADPELLAILPRSADDRIEVSWDHVAVARNPAGSSRVGSLGSLGNLLATTPMMSRTTLPPTVPPRLRQMHAEAQALRQRRLELLTLLALGPGFQLRLAGGIAAAHAAARSPALTAALAGRFAPVAATWLGIDPDDITVTAHQGPGWGTIRVFGDSAWASLPVGWLASVWACDLAATDGGLVVGVTEPGWPATRVLALPEPDSDPVELAVHRA